MDELKGKVAIVTGAGSGIGEAIAVLFAAEGAKVVVSDVNDEHGNNVVNRIRKEGGEAMYVRADVSSAADGDALVQATVKHYGRLDIAVNNAGIAGPSSPTGSYPVDGWDKVIGVNLSGVFYGMRYQIPEMIKAGGGAIVNIASILGQVGFKNAPAYTAAKHGVVGLTKNAAIEHALDKVRINSVGPAFINTPMLTNNLTPDILAALVSLHPIGRLGESNEVAELVLWLCSDRASFVTGSYYAVDGGYLSQ